MHLRRREELGEYLNDGGLCGYGVEVGVAEGRFANAILKSWKGRALALVDGWRSFPAEDYCDVANVSDEIHSRNFAHAAALAENDSRVKLHRGCSPAAAEIFSDGSLDFVYLDANHHFTAVKEDLKAWYGKVRPGGLFGGHDYLDGFVPRSGRSKQGTLFGVKSAVDLFARSVGRIVAYTTDDPPYVSWYFRRPAAPPPPAGRITLLSGATPDFGPAEFSKKNHERYAAMHGYRYVHRKDGFDARRPAAWSKLSFIRAELERSEFVVWMDADAVVMNAAVRLESFWDGVSDIVIGADYNGLNTGVFFVRNTEWNRDFLTRWDHRSEFTNHQWWEQAALIHLYDSDGDVRRRVSVIPHRVCNGYPHLGLYAAGEFVAHFPGAENRRAFVRQYADIATAVLHQTKSDASDSENCGGQPLRGCESPP